jgi:hypothetical protein
LLLSLLLLWLSPLLLLLLLLLLLFLLILSLWLLLLLLLLLWHLSPPLLKRSLLLQPPFWLPPHPLPHLYRSRRYPRRQFWFRPPALIKPLCTPLCKQQDCNGLKPILPVSRKR